MQCRSCGTAIQPGATRCPSCGTPTSLYASDNSAYDAEAIPYVAYSPAPPTPPASNTASSALSTNTQPSVSQAPPQQPSVQQQQRSGILPATALLLIILALLIVGGGSGVAIYATVFHPAELHAQATAVTQSIFTAQAHATATATANSPQSIYNRITSTNSTLSDPLDGRTISIWRTQGQANNGCAFTKGAYHIHIKPTAFYFYCPASGSSYADFIFQVQVTIINGLDATILFRTVNSNSPFGSYSFDITQTGLYTFGVSFDDQHGNIFAFGRSSAINMGLNQPNIIAVMVQGQNIFLFINKHLVTGVRDATYSSGGIGLLAGNLPRTNVDVAFNNVQIWDLP